MRERFIGERNVMILPKAWHHRRRHVGHRGNDSREHGCWIKAASTTDGLRGVRAVRSGVLGVRRAATATERATIEAIHLRSKII